jgi:anti-sigma factor RsiW
MTMTCDQARDLAPAYVLGALDTAEERAVHEHLASCPEAHEEFPELGGVVPVLAEAVELVEPPAALRDRIMAAAAADLEARRGAASAPEPPPIALRTPPREGRWSLRPAWVVGLAAVLAIVALGAWNVRLQGDLATAQAYQRRVDEVLAIARTPGATVAVLIGAQPSANSGIVAVRADGRAAMVVSGLPAIGGAGIYEVWVIIGTNAPVPVGALTESGGLAYMTGTLGIVPPGTIVAITREAGPTAIPTLPILSKGVAGAPS